MLSLFTFATTYIEEILSLPTVLPEKAATVALLMVFAILSALESHSALPKQPAKTLRQSYQTNAGIFIFNSIVISLLSACCLFFVSDHYSGWGLLDYVSSPVWKAALAFLFLDLMLYIWHRACHRFDVLWIFHKVHHSDPALNVSTAFRIHLLELLITTLLKSIYIITFGIDKKLMLTNEALFTVFIMLHHSNITFKGENLLGRVIIVPHLHRVHHSAERCEHDRNYGAVLSIWDRLFGTLAVLEPAQIGIKGNPPQTFLKLVKFGFTDTAMNPQTLSSSGACLNLQAMIAEAAYYKAEKRAFHPGNELCDWLEAKREIIRRVYGDQRVIL
ncbi:Sterol desaturase/sphingolipid hydroxylase (Fatty acid hydroxylase superfamily) [Candidatus Methylobacter favarea]|uniref:Sterol desaturase/sphingolipid hydroxylase (Fatty acid hydroxylase superfamily) n=1 Tax=Candidatus Methylobacter favarea TaxID=2707345 RepID=A0A8S0Y6Q2_9GAMM|nr:sterol desaturase family protein [Candidatus Methylobacter favarea]CAA9891887.1 Sterol desaturase/sphingolipid hydroxylase (Fatty acid hydroxylase superfamily) [Candidatus Methylobacter favarea]